MSGTKPGWEEWTECSVATGECSILGINSPPVGYVLEQIVEELRAIRAVLERLEAPDER
jgi:hypothetical protein